MGTVPDCAAILQEAIVHHRAGRLIEAEGLYAAILHHRPNHGDALHLLGVIAHQRRQYDVALDLIGKAIAVNPLAPEYHNSLGGVRQALGDVADAVNLYIHAIQLKDDYLEPYNNLIRLRPAAVDVRFNLGCMFHRQGNVSAALEQYDKVIELQSNHAGALNNKGIALRESGRLDEAVVILRKAVQAQPDYAEAYHNLGFVLQEKGELAEAIACYHTVLSLKPDFADAHLDLGRALQLQGYLDLAIQRYQQTLALVPSHPKAYYNWAGALHEQGRDSDAIDKYGEAIRCDPGFVEAHVNRAFVLLINGRYQEGWPEYEWRLQRPDWQAVNSIYPELPRWDGAARADQCILVQAEQGFGDTIQFARYFPLVKARCGKLMVEAQPELHPLLETMPAIDQVTTRASGNTSKADCVIHIMSLAGIFATTIDTIPSLFPYLHAPLPRLEKWRDLISPEGFRVGITWSGNPVYPGNKDRSCHLQQFAALAAVPGVRLFSLQKGQPAEQLLSPPSGMEIVDLAPELHDFADTAAAIMHLDLIISVDTALVHLAGALGRPIWTLRYHIPYWVWGLAGPGTPWYPSMRLFRQQVPGDWDGLFQQVLSELEILGAVKK